VPGQRWIGDTGSVYIALEAAGLDAGELAESSAI